jgi:hypothetical protein
VGKECSNADTGENGKRREDGMEIRREGNPSRLSSSSFGISGYMRVVKRTIVEYRVGLESKIPYEGNVTAIELSATGIKSTKCDSARE